MCDSTFQMETSNPEGELPSSSGSLISMGTADDEPLSKSTFSLRSLTEGGSLRQDDVPSGSGPDDAFSERHFVRKLVYSYPDDELARTNDPEQIMRNYWLPMVAKGIPEGMPVFVIISPEYAARVEGARGEKLQELLGKLANYKGERRISRSVAEREAAGSRWKELDIVTTYAKCMKVTKSGKSGKTKLPRKKSPKKKGPKSSKPISFEDTMIAFIEEGKIRYEVKGRSLACLNNPKADLNDEIIDYFMLMCLHFYREDRHCDLSDILYFPMYCWQMYFFTDSKDGLCSLLRNSFYKLVTQKGEQPDVLKKKFFIIPVVRESHWFLAIVCHPFPKESVVQSVMKGRPLKQCSKSQAKEIYEKWHQDYEQLLMLTFDSMDKTMGQKCQNYDSFLHDTLQYIKNATVLLHKLYWKANEAHELVNAVDLGNMTSQRVITPAQPNTADCGIFTVSNLYTWLCLTKIHHVNYMSACTVDFTLLFSSDELSSERSRMLHFLKKRIPPNVPTPISMFETKEETTAVDFDFNGTQSMLAPTSPPSNSSNQTPFLQLFDIVDRKVSGFINRDS